MRVTSLKPCHRLVTFIILCFSLKAALAALPLTLNHQGLLNDDNGVTIDADVSMSFGLYDFDAGDTAQWSDSRTVAVNQGAFSVQLGALPDTFPINLFETLLWMGLTVTRDTKMLSRCPMTSMAFAFTAQAANRPEGSTTAALYQSVVCRLSVQRQKTGTS